MKRLRCLLALLLLPSFSAAGVIYESSAIPPVGQPGGGLLIGEQYVGTRFELTGTTTITGVAGHLSGTDGTLFAAIIPLSSIAALPATTDLTSIALASALFTASTPSAITTVDLSVTLDAGIYGLVFGGTSGAVGEFGATGSGELHQSSVAAPNPSATFFYRSIDGTWFNSGFAMAYFAVFDDQQVAVPEPPLLPLLSIALLATGILTRRRRS